MDKNGKFDASGLRGYVRETLGHRGEDVFPAALENAEFVFSVRGNLAFLSAVMDHRDGAGENSPDPSTFVAVDPDSEAPRRNFAPEPKIVTHRGKKG